MTRRFKIACTALVIFLPILHTGCQGCSDEGLVATLSKFSGSVEGDHTTGKMEWKASKIESKFYMGHGARTLVKAEASFQLEGDATLLLKEQTQIRFLDKQPKSKGIGLRVESGEVELFAGTGEFKLLTGNGSIMLSSGGKMNVRKTEKGLDVNVLIGSAIITQKGKAPVTVQQGETFQLVIGDVELMDALPDSDDTGTETDSTEVDSTDDAKEKKGSASGGSPNDSKDSEEAGESTKKKNNSSKVRFKKKGSRSEKKVSRRNGKIGTIDPQKLRSFMNAKSGTVKSCYERRLRSVADLGGKVDLNIEISPSGKVSNVSVNEDTVNDGVMLACVKRVVRGWKFPKPEGGKVVVAKTFNFKRRR